MEHAKRLSEEFKIKQEYAQNIIDLLDEGNTIPFIARYRKEMHGTLDDQTIRSISERLEYLRGMDKRTQEVYSLIDGMGKMTDEISAALLQAKTLAEIEDIYRPYRPKRRTRASVAKEKGLEPLAEEIMSLKDGDPEELAKKYIDEEKGVTDVADALQGASDIIAENISDNVEIRKRIKNIIRLNGSIVSKAADPEKDSEYSTYYNYRDSVKNIASHRILAIDRGEREDILKVSIETEPDRCLNIMYRLLINKGGTCAEIVKQACADAYSRLIFPSVEREIRSELTDRADEQAIRLFAMNLRQLLMQPPVKGYNTIGLDPGYRTGCKTAVLDSTGRVLDTAVIYPTHGKNEIQRSKETLKRLIKKYNVGVIAIGNGTASKETEIFTAECISEIDQKVEYMVVSEAGASVYSASKLAAEEMPELDLTLRSAVSIARRLQDPLSELVKIEPKAIGVGQYQHDMPKKQLSDALDGVVEACVNSVGADLNTASPALLSHIAGINKTISANIVAYREENGAFASRNELKKVPKLGPKAFQQCAGFLRVSESKEALDRTAVHPESYDAAKKLLSMCGYTEEDIINKRADGLKDAAEKIGLDKISLQTGIGIPTLCDIISEITKPGRDPRDELPPPLLRSDVLDIKDLKTGMTLKGTVRNVVDFGAFVDIGVHQDGLLHISEISTRRIKHPSEVLSVGDVITVKILGVDEKKGRISLSTKDMEV